MTSAPVTLCFLLRDLDGVGTEVLLGLKKTGFGTGKIVGVGGHIEPGESAAEAVCREVYEETGITVLQSDLRPAGKVDFVFPARPLWNMSAILFTTRTWQGEPAESIEIIPEWFLLDSLPLERMWADAEHWLPLALTTGEVNVVVTLNPDNETVQSAVTISGLL